MNEPIMRFSKDGKSILSTMRFGDNAIIGDVTGETSVAIPAWIMCHPMLSDRAVRLWGYMKGALIGALDLPGTTHSSLAKVLDVSERTARTAIYELRDAGAITVQETFADNAQLGNVYYLWPVGAANVEMKSGIGNADDFEAEGWQMPTTPGGNQLPADYISNNIKDTAQNSAKPSKRNKNSYDEQFATLWKLYPRHVNKSGAYKAYCALVKKGVKYDDLLAAVKVYAAQRLGQDEKYTLYAATFFGPNDRWADYSAVAEANAADELGPDGDELIIATIYDLYDDGEGWVDYKSEQQGEVRFDNPAKYGYSRPINSKGQLVSASGVPYELDAQGQRHALGYWK